MERDPLFQKHTLPFTARVSVTVQGIDARDDGTLRDWKKAGSPRPRALPRPEQDPITREVATDLEVCFPDAPDKAADFALPVTREESLKCMEHFVEERLPHFGTWQDLMIEGEPDMFHSIISPILNIGLLDPLECAKAAQSAFRKGKAPMNTGSKTD